MPSIIDRTMKAVARAVTISDSETGTNNFKLCCIKSVLYLFEICLYHVNEIFYPPQANATAQIQSTPLMGEGDGDGDGDDRRDSWVTSVGKFRFLIEELPPFLQFTYELLKVLKLQHN